MSLIHITTFVEMDIRYLNLQSCYILWLETYSIKLPLFLTLAKVMTERELPNLMKFHFPNSSISSKLVWVSIYLSCFLPSVLFSHLSNLSLD